MKSTLIGATINIILNYILIKKVGTIGSGIATAISYFVISIIRIVQVKKQIKLQIEFRRIIPSYILLILLTAFVSLGIKNVVAISSVLVITLVVLNSKYILQLKGVGLALIGKRRKK